MAPPFTGSDTSNKIGRARLATAALFFANGCGLGSWLPHIPDVKIWHGPSDGVLGLAWLAVAGRCGGLAAGRGGAHRALRQPTDLTGGST